jgi:hypothetical protein
MNSLAVFALWMLARSQGSTAPSPQNVVRICSLASPENPCQDLDARRLEPAPTTERAAAAGQRAFVDPETGSLVEPTREQVKELSVILSESMDRRQEEAKVQVLPDGTLRAPGGSLMIYSKAVVATPEKTGGEKP